MAAGWSDLIGRGGKRGWRRGRDRQQKSKASAGLGRNSQWHQRPMACGEVPGAPQDDEQIGGEEGKPPSKWRRQTGGRMMLMPKTMTTTAR